MTVNSAFPTPFDDRAINDDLSPELDNFWIERINDAFPHPYVTEAEEQDAFYTPERVEKARVRNLTLAAELRREMIAKIPLLDLPSMMDIMELKSRVLAAQANHELIFIEDHGLTLYPAFQLDPATFEPYPVVALLSAQFAKEVNKWGELSWWTVEHVGLNGEVPAKLLVTGRAAELEAAVAELTRRPS